MTRFRLAADGSLEPKDCVLDTPPESAICGQAAPALFSVDSISVTPDAKSLYVTAASDDAITKFDRDPDSGTVRPRGCIDELSIYTSEVCPRSLPGLGSPDNVITPTRRSIYFTGGDDVIWHFARDPRSGRIAPADCVEDDDPGGVGCARLEDGIDSPRALAASPDGRNLYAVSGLDSAVVTFDVECSTRTAGSKRADSLAGTGASDHLVGRGGGDELRGAAGNDCLEGEGGSDRLAGGPGEDLAVGGKGADTLLLRDGSADEARCGAGHDLAVIDAKDVVRGCERVRRG